MTWDLLGIFAGLALAVFAFARSRVPGGFYDREVYGMTSVTHVRYALLNAGFAGLFAAMWLLRAHIEMFAIAAFAVVAILYFSSFLRGAHEDDV